MRRTYTKEYIDASNEINGIYRKYVDNTNSAIGGYEIFHAIWTIFKLGIDIGAKDVR